MEVYPEKMDAALHVMRYAYDAVFRPFFQGIPPSEKLLQSFLLQSSLFTQHIDLMNMIER